LTVSLNATTRVINTYTNLFDPHFAFSGTPFSENLFKGR